MKNILAKVTTHAKSGVIVIAMGILLSAGITAAWSSTVWNTPDDWITSGAVISAQKLGENLNYLYTQTVLMFGVSSYTKYIGGGGGSPVILTCPEGTVVTGVNARSGAYVDGFSLICTQIGTATGGNSVVAAVYSWSTGAWSSCPMPYYGSCGQVVHGTQTRSVTCVDQNGVAGAESNCNAGSKPTATKSCSVTLTGRQYCDRGR